MDYFGYNDAKAYKSGAGLPNPRVYFEDDYNDWRCHEAYEARVLNGRLKSMARSDVGVHFGEYFDVYGNRGMPSRSPVPFVNPYVRKRARKQAFPKKAE